MTTPAPERSGRRSLRGSPTTAVRRWLIRWGPLLPILIAEFIILLGFGALLPVLPLYVVEHGIDVPTLGLIAAAWSIAKLVAEPIFGYLADRTRRKPFLIGGAIVLGIATMLPSSSRPPRRCSCSASSRVRRRVHMTPQRVV